MQCVYFILELVIHFFHTCEDWPFESLSDFDSEFCVFTNERTHTDKGLGTR